MRIQVYLSHNGVCSRRDAMVFIKDGRVALNGVIVKEPSTAVDPSKDRIEVDGRHIAAKKFDYVLLHKPAGFVTTKEDVHAERTVMDLLPKHLQHLVPVGRLDKDTEGLLLLTNDGDLTFSLTHPQFVIDKTYLVQIGGTLLLEKKLRLERGVHIEGGMTQPAKISDVKEKNGQTEFLMTIYEGRKRQVRLMMKSVGCSVRYLKRMAQGPLQLGNLVLGQWRALLPAEISALKLSRSPQKVTHQVQAPKARIMKAPAVKRPREKQSEHEYQTRGFSSRGKTGQHSKRTFSKSRRPKNDHS